MTISHARGDDPSRVLGTAAGACAGARSATGAMQAAWAQIIRSPGKEAAFAAWSAAEGVRPDVLYTHVLGRDGTAAGVTASLLAAAGQPAPAAGRPAARPGRRGGRRRG